MVLVYHGSREHGIKRLEPRKSTHGVYVYATPSKVLALHFSGRCGDDFTYDIGHFDSDKEGPWELVELIPGAFEKMYSNSSSIYSLPDDTFIDIQTGFREVVSEEGVDVIDEEYCENVYDGIKRAEAEGLVKIYRYPNKPAGMKQDGTDLLDKLRNQKKTLNKEFRKDEFDRLVCLHPELLEKINDLAKEMGCDYSYKPEDLVELFRIMAEMQLRISKYEFYIDCSYISICDTYPELKEKIDVVYGLYKEGMKTLGTTQVEPEKSSSGMHV